MTNSRKKIHDFEMSYFSRQNSLKRKFRFLSSDEMMIQIFPAVDMAASDWLLVRLKTTNQVAPHAALAT